MGLSGGIDSAVTASVCAKAIGPQRMLGLLMFERRMGNSPDLIDARNLAASLKIESSEFAIEQIVESFLSTCPINTKDRVAMGNLKARARMTSLYFAANAKNFLVAGTGDRSEDLIGYFTKYGDGGVDFLPIAHLYKTQVRALGSYLGLPKQIVEKPSSPNLWEGHLATDEIPLGYDLLDLALVSMFDMGMKPSEASRVLGIGQERLEEILHLHNASAHKRAYPPMIGGW